MKYILFSFLFFSSLLSHAQKINYSISLSYNQPYIATIEESPNIPTVSPSTGYYSYFTNYANIEESYHSKSSGKISGKLNYFFNSRLFIEGGLQLNILRFKQKTEIIEADNIQQIEIGEIINVDTAGLILFPTTPSYYISSEDQEKLGNTSILYTEIPVLIGYSFFNNKLKCKLGLTTSFVTYAQIYKYDTDVNSGFNIIKDKSADGFNNLLLNTNVELEYLVYKNVGINVNYS